jgi:hypothetical protein
MAAMAVSNQVVMGRTRAVLRANAMIGHRRARCKHGT